MGDGFRDYYAILGVKKGATEKEIKAAYRKAARQWHPDVNPGNQEAEERFKEVAEAYEVLSDPEKRQRYDALGPDWQRLGGAGRGAGGTRDTRGGSYEYRTVSPEDLEDLFGSASPFSDFFSSLFGGGERGARGAVRTTAGRDVEATLEVSLEEAFRGGTRTVELQDAGGRRRVEVRIPPGVADGTRLRLGGQGESGTAGGAGGDLYLRVSVQPDTRFERRGDDLYTTVRVPVTTMVLGGEVDVPGPDGRSVTARVPAETPNGRTLRLRGQGMPRLRRATERGDLYVRCEALLPVGLSDEERRLFRRLAELRSTAPRAA